MNKKKYSSSLKKTPYKYAIAKKIAKLLLEGMDRSEIYDKCYIKNIIEVESEQRRLEIINIIYDRLLRLDDFLLKQFVFGDIDTSRFILVYATAKTDLLFFDFMFEVYREALIGRKDYISPDDFDNFFNVKKETDLIVSSWSKYTIGQLAKGYRNIIVNSGMGMREKRNIKTNKIMIHPVVQEHIEKMGDFEYLRALLGD